MIDVISYTNQATTLPSILNSQPIFPTLRILPVEKLLPHEYCDMERSNILKERLLQDGILRNPPIVVPLQDEAGNYMVLDGANRTNAFKMMGVPHILVQIASPDSPDFGLTSWNQVVLGVSSEELLSILDGVVNICLKKDPKPAPGKDGFGASILMQVHLADHQIYHVITQTADLQGRVQLLNLILSRIGDYASLDRTHLDVLDVLIDLHPDLAGLIVFPCFNFEETVQLATERQMIPAGITHFSISPRALRVNYAISDLCSDLSLVEKNEKLLSWIQARVTLKGVRFYSETTVMFDE